MFWQKVSCISSLALVIDKIIKQRGARGMNNQPVCRRFSSVCFYNKGPQGEQLTVMTSADDIGLFCFHPAAWIAGRGMRRVCER
jgi:hypothetical protein